MPPRTTSLKTHRQAYHLRHNPTEIETKLWSRLRAHRLDGVHFRRQYTIDSYIVDFCSPSKKLVIEVDGSQHLEREAYDEKRTVYLKAKGYRILRFWNHEVSNDLDGVIKAIQQALIEFDNND